MGFQDLSEFFDPSLKLPVRGKVYTIPEASAATGIRLRQMVALRGMTRVDEQREAFQLLGAEWVMETVDVYVWDPETDKQILDKDGKPVTEKQSIGKWAGGLFDEMSNDGLTIEEIEHIGMTALLKTLNGLEEAEKHWATGLTARQAVDAGNPEPPQEGANRATRRAAKKSPSKKAPAKKSPAKKATRKSSSPRGTAASTTRAQAPTGRTTPAEPTTTR